MVKKSSIYLKTVSLSLSVGLMFSISLPGIAKSSNSQSSQPEGSPSDAVVAQRQQRQRRSNVRRSRLKFNVPNVGSSRLLESGAARGFSQNCPKDAQAKALLPTTNNGLTVSTSPKFFVYLSQVSAPTAEFTLNDAETDEIVYEAIFLLPKTPGVVSVSLPETVNPAKFKVGKRYRWYFAVKCVPGEASLDLFTGGEIQRIEASSTLVQSLKKATPAELPAVYAEKGVWFDALKSLANLRAVNPNNLDIAADWKALLEESALKSDELNLVTQAPIVSLKLSP